MTTPLLAFPTLDPNPATGLNSPYFTADYDFEGIVSLSNCSGSLVRFDHSEPNDPGMILTNGHCVSMMAPGVVMVNRSSSRSFRVMNTSGSRLGTAYANRLLFATMTKTDMALYQLSQSYDELSARFNVEPLTFSRQGPAIGDSIEVISGYWRRGYSCQVEAITNILKEGDWLFENSIRYSRPGCDVIGGTSGSPILLEGTRIVVGVNNTINERGRRCEVNNPCEIDPDGTVRWEKGWGYAQQVAWVYSCLDDSKNIKLDKPGCLLPSPSSVAMPVAFN